MESWCPSATTQSGAVGVGGVTGTVGAIADNMVDPPHGEAGVQRVPGGTLIGMNRGDFGNPRMDRRGGVLFGGKQLRQRASAAFAHGDGNLARTRFVFGKRPAVPVGGQIPRPHVTAEIRTG